MSVTTRLTQGITGGEAISPPADEITAGSRIQIDETVNDSESNFQISLETVVTNEILLLFYMVSDQDVTVYTNDVSGGSPDETIVLAANVPFIWTDNMRVHGYTNVLQTTLTDLYVTNASGANAKFQVEVLVDPTP